MCKTAPLTQTRLLKIDIDLIVDKSWLTHYRHKIRVILDSYKLTATSIRITPSRSKGYHVRIYLSKLVSSHMALLLQWLCSDDHARTDFNRARVNVGFDEWDKFFE